MDLNVCLTQVEFFVACGCGAARSKNKNRAHETNKKCGQLHVACRTSYERGRDPVVRSRYHDSIRARAATARVHSHTRAPVGSRALPVALTPFPSSPRSPVFGCLSRGGARCPAPRDGARSHQPTVGSSTVLGARSLARSLAWFPFAEQDEATERKWRQQRAPLPPTLARSVALEMCLFHRSKRKSLSHTHTLSLSDVFVSLPDTVCDLVTDRYLCVCVMLTSSWDTSVCPPPDGASTEHTWHRLHRYPPEGGCWMI